MGIQASGMSSPLSLLKLFGIKSYVDSLFEPTCVPVGVTINKLHLAPNRNMPRFVSVFRNRRSLSTRKPYVSVMSFILSRIDLKVSPIYAGMVLGRL